MIWRFHQESCRSTRKGLPCWVKRLLQQKVYMEILSQKKIGINHPIKMNYDWSFIYYFV